MTYNISLSTAQAHSISIQKTINPKNLNINVFIRNFRNTISEYSYNSKSFSFISGHRKVRSTLLHMYMYGCKWRSVSVHAFILAVIMNAFLMFCWNLVNLCTRTNTSTQSNECIGKHLQYEHFRYIQSHIYALRVLHSSEMHKFVEMQKDLFEHFQMHSLWSKQLLFISHRYRYEVWTYSYLDKMQSL